MNFIEKAQAAYDAGTPIISDAQYDELIRIGKAEETIGPKGEFKHPFPMWSLQKKYPGRGDILPSNLKDYVETPKLDGNAVALVYVAVRDTSMELQTFATRGDGSYGKLIDSSKANLLKIPRFIERVFVEGEGLVDYIQITGEVVSTVSIDNARNIVSGAINLDSISETAARFAETGAVFAAYNLEGIDFGTYKQTLNFLDEQGFMIPVDQRLANAPKDGVVYRLNDNSAYIAEGWTAKFPRGAFAVKEDAEYVVTTLLAVEWSTGRSGVVTPRALLAEVEINGAKIRYATLNNPAYIKEMGLYIGAKVKVIRSGEIIPQVLGLAE